MSTLIYCKNSIAANPFYIEEGALNVYSLEELSYYILNNSYSLSDSFKSIELCNWIGRELHLADLSSELVNLISSNVALHIFAAHILTASNYASDAEKKEAIKIISAFENKSPLERKKLRADRLMAAGKISDAIFEYESLLSDEYVKSITKAEEGFLYHNLGCAFSRLFFWSKAITCFDEAYKKTQSKQSLYCLFFAIKCSRNSDVFTSYVDRYQVSKETITEIETTINAATGKAVIIDFDQKINQLLSSESLSSQLYDYAAIFTGQIRDDYTKMCRL